MTVSELAAVVGELAPALLGGRIQQIHQPLPLAITLDIRAPGQTHTVLLSADPETARVHRLRERLPNPDTPPAFCQLLRAHVRGARIEGIEQIAEDRIVRIAARRASKLYTLVAALTGRSADLYLLDEDDIVMAGLRTQREHAGARYQPPQRSAGWEPADHLRSADAARDGEYPISATIESRYAGREAALAQERWRGARLAALRRTIKKTARRVEALESDLRHAEQYRDYARYGDLLKTSLSTIERGACETTVVDYYDPALPVLTIPLDPAKGPHANMEDYFRKHRKYVMADREIRPRLADTIRSLDALKAERAAIERGDVTAPAAGVGREAHPKQGLAPPRRQASEPRKGPFRRFFSLDGLPIFVGRNADENEDLTFGMAQSDDLWLHAHGVPGSHVVVRLEKGSDPPPETLKDAATLALLYSDLKKSGKGEVMYTRRKYVRRVKGSRPGTVTVTREKTVYVTLDRTRLERLKQSR